MKKDYNDCVEKANMKTFFNDFKNSEARKEFIDDENQVSVFFRSKNSEETDEA